MGAHVDPQRSHPDEVNFSALPQPYLPFVPLLKQEKHVK